ncbi:MAG: EscU/YscU/HrcU family type III secretion system export apparatus switch protein [Spirochaetaceae bacterium]|nr:EscU/YscU/HrcU family type III secretion system export apparatus switch protein [Spirochaetaceae bacterium]
MKKRREETVHRYAAALAYRAEDPAPRVLAAGTGGAAERIVTAAREAGVAIVEDAPLAALLAAPARSGDYVPAACWEAVAKILAFVWKNEEARGQVQNRSFGKSANGGILRSFFKEGKR